MCAQKKNSFFILTARAQGSLMPEMCSISHSLMVKGKYSSCFLPCLLIFFFIITTLISVLFKFYLCIYLFNYVCFIHMIPCVRT